MDLDGEHAFARTKEPALLVDPLVSLSGDDGEVRHAHGAGLVRRHELHIEIDIGQELEVTRELRVELKDQLHDRALVSGDRLRRHDDVTVLELVVVVGVLGELGVLGRREGTQGNGKRRHGSSVARGADRSRELSTGRARVGPVTAPDSLTAQAALVPEKAAVLDPEGERLTFAELEARANRLAHGLAGLGLAGGDPVIWCGPNSVEVLVVLHAARKAGLVAVPLAYRFTADEMRYVIADSGAAVVLVDPEQAERVAAVRAELPAVRAVVVFGSPEWHALLEGDATPPPAPDGAGGSMIYTSGTTGKPKGAVRGPTDPEATRTLAATLRLRPHEEVHLTTGPLYHSGPLAWALITHALGGTVVLLRRFDAARWVELVREHGVTNTFTAPTPLKRVVALPEGVLARADLSSMRSLVVNAAPVPYALKQEVIARFGDGFLFEIYGSTELGVDAVLPPEEQVARPGS